MSNFFFLFLILFNFFFVVLFRYTKSGQLAISGFSNPFKDPSPEDTKLWMPDPINPPVNLDLEMSRFVLTKVGDQFCDLLHQEKQAMSEHMSDGKFFFLFIFI